MTGYIRIIVIGNVGTDPEMRYTPQGIATTSFRLAASRFFTPAGGERQQETEWFSVVTWRQLAEQCNQYLTKGRRAYVEGRLRSHTWQGPDGVPRFRNEVVADRVIFLDRPAEVGPPGGEAVETPSSDAEDLPF